MTQPSLSAEEGIVVADEAEAPAQVNEEDYIRLSRKDLHRDLARYVDEDAEFGQAARTIVGSRVKRPVEAENAELRARVAQTDHAQTEAHYQHLRETGQLEETLRDPAEAERYSQHQRRTPPNPGQARLQAELDGSFEDALDDLRDAGAPKARLDAYQAAYKAGYFFTENGQRVSPIRAIRKVSEAVRAELKNPAQFGWGAPAPEKEKPKGNPALATRVDGSPAGGSPGGTNAIPRTKTESRLALYEGRIDTSQHRRNLATLPD